MNALVRKEVRLLLPTFVIGLVLACSIWLVPDKPGRSSDLNAVLGILAFMVSPAMLVMLTLGSFGREISAGTFSFLLSQPVPRSRVWWTKSLLLAVATGILWAVWWFSLSSNRNFLEIPKEDRSDAFVTAVLFTIVVYAGGLWTTVFLRQLAGAFWFTLLVPAALTMTMVSVFPVNPDGSNPHLKTALILALSLYSVAGFVFSRWLFLRAQDSHWTGGTLALPDARGLTGWADRSGDRRQHRPRAALWVKELQLHQSQFMLAALLALLHLAVLAARKFGGGFKSLPTLEFLLEHFWVLWMAMPLLVGAAAVAEERQLGTLEGQLCLPARRRTQFGIKFATALLLFLLLGVAMPLLIEGTRILPDFSYQSGDVPENYAITIPGGTVHSIANIVAAYRAVLPWVALMAIGVSVGFISFYASSLARNTLQALAPAVLGMLVAWVLFFAALVPREVFHFPLWNGGLIYLIGLPVMLVTLLGLMYCNLKRVVVGWVVWRRNAVVLLTALVGVAAVSSAIYHRTWEHFATLEPPHGPTRLPRSVRLHDGGFNMAVQFPDGRNWSTRLTLSTPDWAAMLTGDWKAAAVAGTSGFLEGSNWLSVGRSYRDVIGVQVDGSLWVSEQPEKPSAAGPLRISPSPQMVRSGQQSDWQAVAANGAVAFLLKTNGTLWRLGTNRVKWKNWTGFAGFIPERLGTDTDWTAISRMEHGRLAFHKADGRVWAFPRQLPSGRTDPDTIPFDADTVFDRVPYFDGQKSVASAWVSASPGRNVRLGVGKDGSLRVIAMWGQVSKAGGLQLNWGLVPQNIPLGNETNWLALADNQYEAVALKTDGTLWNLNFAADPIQNPESFKATRLSGQPGWVALAGTMDGMMALAADGNLWFWAMEGRRYYPSGFTLQPLLAASRRPQLVGNLFDPPAR